MKGKSKSQGPKADPAIAYTSGYAVAVLHRELEELVRSWGTVGRARLEHLAPDEVRQAKFIDLLERHLLIARTMWRQGDKESASGE
jgi:hypothetical protein